MFKFSIFIAILFTTLVAHAGLEQLSSSEMKYVVGQGGADLSWTLSLNHIYANDLKLEKFSDKDVDGNIGYKYNCVNAVLCRLAISPNNHLDANNNKKWLVFKGIQGTLQIDEFKLDGTTITRNLGTTQEKGQTALQISFKDEFPLKIRNLGFNTMSIETGTGEDELEGYANINTYTNYTGRKYNEDGTFTLKPNESIPQFDNGAEQGFMGLNIHGNLHMSGNIKIFSYNCDGSGRC